MSDYAFTRIMFVLLLAIVALLAVRDWQLQGEVELLHDLIHGEPADVYGSTVQRILRARTDEAAEQAARGEA